MILDGVPDQAGNHPTLLLKAGNKAIIARRIDIKKLHGHVVGQVNCAWSGRIAHKPGSEGHDVVESQVIGVFDEIFEHGQSGIVRLTSTGSLVGNRSRDTIPMERDTHEAHPTKRDGLVSEQINDRLAVWVLGITQAS